MTKFTPYWWEGQPHYSESNRMPKNADVVIVGAGFTGLSAAITLAKSSRNEALPNSPQFNTDLYDRVTVAAAGTGDLFTSGADEDYALYKMTISAAAAQVVDVFWTDSANANAEYIGNIRFSGEGTWVYDFDPAFLRNPNRQGGKLRYTTSTAASTVFDIIGHEGHAGK